MLKLSSTTNVAVSWEAGAFGPILPWLAGYLRLIAEASGGGFAADGSFYGFLAAAPDVTKAQLAVKDATVDAAGTLFLVREGTLFSMKLW
jgi:hypothetical protein